TLRHSDLDSLDPSVDYYYRVRAYKGHSATCGDWDGLYTNITNEATNPAKPTAFLASPEGSMKIKLTWTDNAVDETSYKIEKKMWNNVWVEIDSIAQNSELYRDTLGLNPDSSYTYRIRAYRSGDNSYSPYSDEATTTTNIYGGQWVDDTTCLPIE
ncbi:MAG: fibronectin type III domain-containing protein, partial [Proteobacteria bacterium]|nr:fibronectin type III domain-containing protein [Pseudomonadota bacterium]